MHPKFRRAPIGAMVAAVLLWAASASAQGFHAVTTKDGTDVWAVGDAGSIWRSFDGATTFTSATLGTTPLRGVAHNGLTVLIVGDGGKVNRSTNNGGTFATQTLGAGAM